MKYQKFIKLLPLIILVLLIAYCFYTIATTNIILVEKHYLGIAFVIASVVLVIFQPKIGMYLTGVTLLFGTMNFVAFTPVVYTYSFGFSLNGIGIDFRIQLHSFLLLLFFIALNSRELFSQAPKVSVDNKEDLIGGSQQESVIIK